MDVITDRVPDFASPFESAFVSKTDEDVGADLSAEINQRRAEVENPEMLRHLRSL